jgi:hypothetical protein
MSDKQRAKGIWRVVAMASTLAVGFLVYSLFFHPAEAEVKQPVAVGLGPSAPRLRQDSPKITFSPPAMDRPASLPPGAPPGAFIPEVSKRGALYGLPQVGEAAMIIPRPTWRISGKATIPDALQSIYAAAQSGDIDYLERAILFEEGARMMLQPYWDSLTEEQRTQHVSLQRLAAEFVASAPPIKGYTLGVVSRDGAEGVSFGINLLPEKHDGKFKGAGVRFQQQTNGEWLQVVTTQMAAKWVRALTDDTFASGPFVELKNQGRK